MPIIAASPFVANGAALGAFAAIAAGVYAAIQAARRSRLDTAVAGRLGGAARGEPAGALAGPLGESLAGQFPQLEVDKDALDRDLRRAGHYRPTARREFLATRNALIIAVVIGAATLAVVIGPERESLALKVAGGGLVLASLAWALPRIWLRGRGTQRVNRIQRAMPDALDMITMSLTGGLTLEDALGYVSRELHFAHPDLAVELGILLKHAEMSSLEDGFAQLARRIDAPDVLSITTLVSQAQRLGTDVVTSIRDYADGIRLKRRHQADEQANKMSFKLLFPVVLCLAPAVFIILWGPAVLELVNYLRNFGIQEF